jgi:16S rRNA A1518/A1519 N6-dimethyltransferase RsmA/KsgA/DIM1 with predicted DNA glycosylase/AP lyase activity
MDGSAAQHWDTVYGSAAPADLSWFQQRPATSLRLLAAAAPPSSSVLDVGAGRSALAEMLLDVGWSDVTVLDVSAAALAGLRTRGRAEALTLVVADVLCWQPTRS